MPIIDINGTPLAHYSLLDPSISTIEFGAGKGFFGKKEFPSCYTTDREIPSVEHFSRFPNDYETRECHFIDATCDYLNLELNGHTFNHIVLCNPYGIGFSGRNNTKYFLMIANAILNPDGIITILGNSTNPWSTYSNIEKHYKKLVEDKELEDLFTHEVESINDNHRYRLDHCFYRTGFKEPTYPNQLIKIKKIA